MDTYVGHEGCANWKGTDGFEERECCGGRRMMVATVRCSVRGGVDAMGKGGMEACSVRCSKCPMREEAPLETEEEKRARESITKDMTKAVRKTLEGRNAMTPEDIQVAVRKALEGMGAVFHDKEGEKA